jgi:hypothetical protein
MLNQLLKTYEEPGVHSWNSYDNERLFKKNSKTMPQSWIYRTKKVEYKNNSRGYRAPEFDKINWKKSIVILGDSNVYGEGLAEEDTISCVLSHLSGYNVVNLGSPGSSIEYSFINSLILKNNYSTPKAIVQLWTTRDRYTEFLENRKKEIVPHTKLPKMPEYDFHKFWDVKSDFYRQADKIIWKDTLYYEASFFDYVAEEYSTDHLDWIDAARDCSHPGIKSAFNAAKKIYENLKQQGL